MENITKLNEKDIPNVVGGKCEKNYPGKKLLEDELSKSMLEITARLGMPECTVLSSSYLDDHDDNEQYDTLEMELKAKCPTSKLRKGNGFDQMMVLLGATNKDS